MQTMIPKQLPMDGPAGVCHPRWLKERMLNKGITIKNLPE